MRNQNLFQKLILLTCFVSIIFSPNCVFAQKGKTQNQMSEKRSNEMKNNKTDTDPENEESNLIGKWTSSEAKIEFFKDGKMTINGEKFNYGVVGKIILVESDEGQMEFPFTLKGNTLTVLVDDRKVVYTRSTKNEDTSENDQKPKPEGSNPQEFVGKWCYQSNVNASGGGRMSNICFVLYENGTYEYYGETSSSNPYGGTNSQSNDAGRWKATSTTLTAYSNSGETRTYSLEKRNHPKTGDPMLIVEGDAFVTFYQRQPW